MHNKQVRRCENHNLFKQAQSSLNVVSTSVQLIRETREQNIYDLCKQKLIIFPNVFLNDW